MMGFTIRVTYVRAIAGLLVLAGVAWLSAGSPTPPGGAVSPTMKMLDQPRSYELAVGHILGGHSEAASGALMPRHIIWTG